MYQVVAKYTTGDTNGRDTEIYEEILVSKEEREEANKFASLFLEYIQTEQRYDYAFGKRKEEGRSLLFNIGCNLIALGAIQFNGLILYNCLGYFEIIEEIFVREAPQPEKEPLFFSWSR